MKKKKTKHMKKPTSEVSHIFYIGKTAGQQSSDF